MSGERDPFNRFDVSQLIHKTPSPLPEQTATESTEDSKPDFENDQIQSRVETFSLESYFNLIQAILLGKSGNFLTVHSRLRTCLDLSLAHVLQMKGRQRRDLSFHSMSVHNVSHGGRTCSIIVFDTTNVKPFSNRIYGFTRHFRTELCLQFTLSLYLFARFHLVNEEGNIDLTADLLNDPNFLRTKLMNGGQRYRALSYSQQYKAWLKVSKGVGNITPSALSRIVSTNHNTNPALGCVGSKILHQKPLSLPLEAVDIEIVCQRAGFQNASSYHIARARIQPPPELVKQIFPFLDVINPRASMFGPFFDVLHALRISLIQDMVEMKASHPEHFIFMHPIFESKAFHDYFYLARKEIPIPGSVMSDEQSSWRASRDDPPVELHKDIIQDNPRTSNSIMGQSATSEQTIFQCSCGGAQKAFKDPHEPLHYRLDRLESMLEEVMKSITVLEIKTRSLQPEHER